jgi:beta-phosphoglucomutase-like phosphatase (HAD superfamily)
MPVRALLFDFDGTLVDTETPVFEAWQEVYRRHGHVLALDEWRHALGTHGGFDPYATWPPSLRAASAAPASRRRWTARSVSVVPSNPSALVWPT